ncbi:MAG: aminopeptidase [Thermoflexales bacterium]
MYDPRFDKMADVIVNYSLEIKPRQTVYVWSQTPAAPLMLAIYRRILEAGGNAFLRADLPGAQEIFYTHARDEQLDFVSPVDRISVEEGMFDAYVRIGAETNTRRFNNVEPSKVQRHQAALRPILERRLQRSAQGNYNWCVTQFPTEAYAMDADMSLSEYTEFLFAACLVNDPDPIARWRELGQHQQRYIEFLQAHHTLRFQGPDVDLTMTITGRTWKNSCGKRNFPDGEIFSAPHEDSVQGWVRFRHPAIYQGREVSGVELWFEQGRVVRACAEKNEDFLRSVLDTDAGARVLGEVAIGTNYGIKRFSRNILFDEKIGGTFHLALGAGYPDTGATNQSAIHWDLIADAHHAEISADGVVFYRNGQFLI